MNNRPILLIIFIIFFKNIYSERQFLDGIACTRVGESGSAVIFYSDAWFPSPIGMPIKLEDLIIRMSWLHHGSDHGIKMLNDGSSMEYAEKYLDMIQEQRGISRIELQKVCMDAGYSLYDLKKELNDQYLMQQIIETTFAASGLINVTYEEVEEYYKENPPKLPAKYWIKQGKLNCSLEDYNNKKFDEEKIDWADNDIEVNINDISDAFKNIENFGVGEVITVIESENKKEITLFKLNNKESEKLIKISECYEKIQHIIQQKKYVEEYKNYTEKLLNENIYDTAEIKERALLEAQK